MGSFNMSCALTGCSIGYGDEAVVVLCKSTVHWANYMYEKPPDDNFTLPPACYFFEQFQGLSCVIPGIRGIYEDYGNLNWSIEENPHLTDVNEKYCINTLIHPYREGDNEKIKATKERWPNGLFAIWVHAYAWDQVVNWTRSNQRLSAWFPDEVLLKHLGFQKQEENLDMPRYNKLWTHPEWHNHAMASDGSFGRHIIYVDNKWIEGDYCCTYPDMVEITKKYNLPLLSLDHDGTTFDVLDLRQKVHRATRHYYYQREKSYIEKEIKEAEEAGDIHRANKYKKELNYNPNGHRGDCWGFIAGSRYDEEDFCDLWAEKLVDRDPQVEKAIAELQCIQSFFYCSGRMFMPTHPGPQFGEYRYSLQLGKITTEIAQENINNSDDDYDYDDYEE